MAQPLLAVRFSGELCSMVFQPLHPDIVPKLWDQPCQPVAAPSSRSIRFACNAGACLPQEAALSGHLHEDANVEFRVVPLHVAGAVLGADFRDHGRHLFCVSDRNSMKFRSCAPGLDPIVGFLITFLNHWVSDPETGSK